MRKFQIQQPLPGCPAGRIFKETSDKGVFFHSMSDEEFLSGKFVEYKFAPHFIIGNSWFKEVTDEEDKGSVVLYNRHTLKNLSAKTLQNIAMDYIDLVRKKKKHSGEARLNVQITDDFKEMAMHAAEILWNNHYKMPLRIEAFIRKYLKEK